MQKEAKNSEKFLIAYNELDQYMKNALKLEDHVGHTVLLDKMAKKDRVFNQHLSHLKSFAKLRNAIVHNPEKGKIDPIAEPHDHIIEIYEDIKNRVLNPPIALQEIAIKEHQITTVSIKDNALKVMKMMKDNRYTYVPVVKDKRVIGVFSESTIFSYLIKNELAIVERDTLLEDFEEFIPINNHESDYFEFVARNTLVMDIGLMYQEGIKNNKRLSVIFITETGKQGEKLLGMVTPWDIVGFNS